jgi:hypothetical protein
VGDVDTVAVSVEVLVIKDDLDAVAEMEDVLL